MTKQIINIGSAEQSGDGESIRSAFIKINGNFDEIYANYITAEDIPAIPVDINELTDTEGVLGNIRDWTFDNTGSLTFPGEGVIKPITGNINLSAGIGLESLETNYIGSRTLLDDLFTNLSPEPGYPWGITLPVSHATYDELILLASGTIPNMAVVPAANAAKTDYLIWQEALDQERVLINVADKTWQFRGDNILTFPNDALVDSADSNIEFRGMNNFNVEAQGVFNIITGSQNIAYSWTFGDNGSLTVPGAVSSSEHLFLDANYDGGYSVYIGNDHPTAGMLGGVVLGDTRGGFVEVVTTKLIINETSVPAHSTGAVGDQAGQVAFDNAYIYYCTASYNQTGHQVIVATLYNGGTTINSNNLQLTKTSDTLQITVGDVISDSNGGATSVVGTISHDDNYTYIGTGSIAYNCVFPLTFTSTDYVPGGNIWKRVAWSADTW